MSSMSTCYATIKDILGDDIESFDTVALVEKYREYWKPDDVKVVLLAESHVYTTDRERGVQVPQIKGLPNYLREYARFVYCLAYGERLLTGAVNHPDTGGTPHFWKIFYSCLNTINTKNDFASVLRKIPYPQRINNKISLLKEMRYRGIWLVDASIVALYGNGYKPSWGKMSSAIRASWSGFISQKIFKAEPSYIICIGKGVGNILENELYDLMGGQFQIIAQPNSRLSSEEHFNTHS